MKKILRLILLAVLVCSSLYSDAQLTVSNTMSAQQLVQNVLLGVGVTATNITYTGASMAKGTFNGTNSNIGLGSGVLLTTGSIVNALGPNNAPGQGTDNGLLGNPLLTALSGDSTHD